MPEMYAGYDIRLGDEPGFSPRANLAEEKVRASRGAGSILQTPTRGVPGGRLRGIWLDASRQLKAGGLRA